jgi:hypothetical protein
MRQDVTRISCVGRKPGIASVAYDTGHGLARRRIPTALIHEVFTRARVGKAEGGSRKSSGHDADEKRRSMCDGCSRGRDSGGARRPDLRFH